MLERLGFRSNRQEAPRDSVSSMGGQSERSAGSLRIVNPNGNGQNPAKASLRRRGRRSATEEFQLDRIYQKRGSSAANGGGGGGGGGRAKSRDRLASWFGSSSRNVTDAAGTDDPRTGRLTPTSAKQRTRRSFTDHSEAGDDDTQSVTSSWANGGSVPRRRSSGRSARKARDGSKTSLFEMQSQSPAPEGVSERGSLASSAFDDRRVSWRRGTMDLTEYGEAAPMSRSKKKSIPRVEFSFENPPPQREALRRMSNLSDVVIPEVRGSGWEARARRRSLLTPAAPAAAARRPAPRRSQGSDASDAPAPSVPLSLQKRRSLFNSVRLSDVDESDWRSTGASIRPMISLEAAVEELLAGGAPEGTTVRALESLVEAAALRDDVLLPPSLLVQLNGSERKTDQKLLEETFTRTWIQSRVLSNDAASSGRSKRRLVYTPPPPWMHRPYGSELIHSRDSMDERPSSVDLEPRPRTLTLNQKMGATPMSEVQMEMRDIHENRPASPRTLNRKRLLSRGNSAERLRDGLAAPTGAAAVLARQSFQSDDSDAAAAGTSQEIIVN